MRLNIAHLYSKVRFYIDYLFKLTHKFFIQVLHVNLIFLRVGFFEPVQDFLDIVRNFLQKP
jgi:hypothetical protein